MDNDRDLEMQLEYDRAQYQRGQQENLAQQQEQAPPQPPKMGWFIFGSALILCLIADAIDAGTAGTIGWLIGIFIDLILLLILGLSSSAKKQWKKWVGGLVGETIPFVAALPLRTGFLIWAFIASRPQMIGKIAKILKVASKIPSPISAELKTASKVANTATKFQEAQDAPLSQRARIMASSGSNIKSPVKLPEEKS